MWCYVSCICVCAGEEEQEDYEKEKGELGREDAEHIDRNMWAPEEEEEQQKEEEEVGA